MMDEMLTQSLEDKAAVKKLEADLTKKQEGFRSMLSEPLVKAYDEIVFLQKRVSIAQRTESFMDGIRFGAKMAVEATKEPPSVIS